MAEELLTILFTDVEGSTALHAAKGDAEARRILGACDEVVREQVREHGGREIKATGDGFMIAFGSPRKAVACALAIQEANARRGVGVRVRAGLHTGEVSEEGGDLFGEAVNAAARICAKAQGGEVFVSEVVRQLATGLNDVTFEARGRVALRGFPERWRLYRVVSSARPPALQPGQRTAFVGREAEQAELRTVMDQAFTGRGGLVMIGGEPGVGKTRLSEEIAAEGQRRGFVARTGHCYEAQAGLPYMPWVEIIEAALRDMDPTAMRQDMGEAAPEFARLAPQLRGMFPDIPPPLELPPDQQRRYTFSCLSDYVARLARTQPRLYVLEDLQWADESTLLFLDHLAERLPTISLVIMGTYRDPPIEVSRLLANTLGTLVRRRQARLLSLKRHSEDEVATMLRALSGYAAPADVSTTIYAETEGNAFFVEEVFRFLAETGRLLDDVGHFRTDVRIEELEVPRNVRLVIEQRLDRLGEATRRMLAVAAVAGRHCSLELLEAICGMQGDALIDALEEAQLARLASVDVAERETQLWFAHELIRQTLLAGRSTPRRQRYHLRAADALERIYEGDLERHAADIARHLVQAGSAAAQERTATYLTMAGDRAQAAAAFEDALRNYQHALRLLRPQLARQRVDLQLKVLLAQRGLCQFDDMVTSCHEVLPGLQALDDLDAVTETCWQVSVQLGWAYRFDDMLSIANHGLTVIEERSSHHRARLLAARANGLMEATRFEEASTDLQEARRLAEAHGDERLLGEVAAIEMSKGYGTMQLAWCHEAGRPAVQTLRSRPWDLANFLPFLDCACVFLGRFGESDEICRELASLAQRVGHLGALALVRRSAFPKIAAQSADLEALESLSVTQAEAASQLGRGWLAYSSTLHGILALWAGDWGLARGHMAKGTRLAVPGHWFGPHHGFLIVLLSLAGEREEALAVLSEVRDALPTPGRANAIGQWNLAILAAEAAGILCDGDRARALHPLVVEAMATGTVMRQYDGALIQRAAGMAAAAAGLHDEAEEHFEAALRQAAELPHLMERPQVRHFYGRFLLDRGGTEDRDRSRALLEEAVAGYHAIGMPRHEAMARELLAGIDAGRVHG